MTENLAGVIVSEYQSISESFCRVADRLAASAGGPSIRAVVLIERHLRTENPLVVATYPRLVIRMSRMAALACSAPEHWDRFLVVESLSDYRAAVYFRTGGGLHGEMLRISESEDLANAVRLLHVKRCVAAGCSHRADLAQLGQLCELFVGDRSAMIRGAVRFATDHLEREGVLHQGGKSSLAVSRKVGYSIVRPERAVFDPDEATLARIVGTRPVLLVSELNVAAIYARTWRQYAQQNLSLAGELLLDLTESSKVWSQVHDICGYAARCGMPRNGVIVAVGGGVTLDVAGFAASIFRRGVGFVRIPTSLLGLIDVSLGIKQGINAHGRKNLLGSFYPPLASVNDYRFLATLPSAEISCGLAEIVKMALLRDRSLFERLEQAGPELVASRFSTPASVASEVVLRAELLMMEELAPNLFEGTHSRWVDFGHTFSPVIETASHCRIPHGRAVAIDMLISTALAVILGRADRAFLERLIALLPHLGLPIWDDLVPSSAVFFAALNDIKLHRGGSLNLIIVTEIGSPDIVQAVSLKQLDAGLSLLQSYRPSAEAGALPLNEQRYARTAF